MKFGERLNEPTRLNPTRAFGDAHVVACVRNIVEVREHARSQHRWCPSKLLQAERECGPLENRDLRFKASSFGKRLHVDHPACPNVELLEVHCRRKTPAHTVSSFFVSRYRSSTNPLENDWLPHERKIRPFGVMPKERNALSQYDRVYE